MAEARNKMLCPRCGRRYSDHATVKSGQCPRCQGRLEPVPELRSGLPKLRDESDMRDKGKFASRSITMDGQEIEFSEGFSDLHTRVYEQTLAGNGFGIEDARPSIELVYDIRHADLTPKPENLHPMLLK